MAQPTNIDDRDKWPDGYRWQLAENFRRRSDEAANFLRSLLFVLSSTSLGYLASKHYNERLSFHTAAILSFALAIAFIVWSWDRQKDKSIKRLTKLRDDGYEQYLALEAEFVKYRKNSTLDKFSYAFITVGFLIEIVVQTFPSCSK